jgi:flagellar biosynthetic protein FlhB
MADDAGDKTEAPTPRRRQEARDQGNIARSQDLTSATLLVCMLLMLKWFGEGIVTALRAIMERELAPESLSDFGAASAAHAMAKALVQVGGALAPMFIGVIIVIVSVNVAQVGLKFDTKKLQPNLMALNPLKGLGKLFQKQGGVQLAFNMLKLLLVGWIAYTAIHGRMGEIALAQGLEFKQIFHLGASLVYSIGMRIGIFLLVLAILDYGYQWFRVENQLKMTKQEVKDEMKRMEGDPKIKQKRKQFGMQLMVQRLKQDVPTADVVVTNPTHFSVALKYDKDGMHAPKVVAKGQDFVALRIREIAAASGVPILERPPLARGLYHAVEVGQEIPEQFYAAVAEILAYVYELTGKSRRRAASAPTAASRAQAVGVN